MKKSCLMIFVFAIIYYVAAYFLCPIDSERTYTWYSGIWHGIFWFPNLVMSIYSDSIHFKAPNCTTGYNIWFYITIVLSSILGNFVKSVTDALNDKQR